MYTGCTLDVHWMYTGSSGGSAASSYRMKIIGHCLNGRISGDGPHPQNCGCIIQTSPGIYCTEKKPSARSSQRQKYFLCMTKILPALVVHSSFAFSKCCRAPPRKTAALCHEVSPARISLLLKQDFQTVHQQIGLKAHTPI